MSNNQTETTEILQCLVEKLYKWISAVIDIITNYKA